MASVQQCRSALDRLAATLDSVDAEARAKHVPDRLVSCRIKDLDVMFTAHVDADGVHDLTQLDRDDRPDPNPEVRVTISSDELLALADGEDDLITAWVHGRLQVSAPMRDLLRLRSVLGL